MKINKFGFHSISVKFDEKYSIPHQIFFKQHKVREETDDRPSELTLFVCNIPPYYNEDCLKCLFKPCGIVQTILFAETDTPCTIINLKGKSKFHQVENSKGYKIAYIVFKSANNLQNALSWNPPSPIIIKNNEFSFLTGLRKYCQQYNKSISIADEMEQEIVQFISEYDKKLKKEEKILKHTAQSNIGGWVTVTRKGRNPGFARKQSVKDNIMKSVQKKKKRKALLNFYTFQIKESKINHLTKLREKFEEDKKKIQSLKLKRKFKPF
ncbi:hypothetical protein PGB90_005466 [Kerria lacca]